MTPTNTPTQTPTNTPTVSVTQTNTPTVSQTSTLTVTPTPSSQVPTQTPTQTETSTQTPTVSQTSTLTLTPTNTLTLTPTNTPTISLTSTLTLTPTNTRTLTPTPTQTPGGSDDASNSAYNSGLANGSNGGTQFGAWTISTAGTSAGTYVASSTGDGFGDINTGGKSFGLYADNGSSGVYCNRPFSSNLAVNFAFTITLATKWRTGSRGVNLYDSNGTFLVNFSVNNDTYQFNGSTLGGSAGQIGEYSDTARWQITAKQTSSNNVEITLLRADKSLSTVTNKSGILRSFQVYNEFETTSANNNLYFNSLAIYKY